jgi:hypothetical protein
MLEHVGEHDHVETSQTRRQVTIENPDAHVDSAADGDRRARSAGFDGDDVGLTASQASTMNRVSAPIPLPTSNTRDRRGTVALITSATSSASSDTE